MRNISAGKKRGKEADMGGYTWLEEAGLIRGTPEWEERQNAACDEGEEEIRYQRGPDGKIQRQNV